MSLRVAGDVGSRDRKWYITALAPLVDLWVQLCSQTHRTVVGYTWHKINLEGRGQARRAASGMVPQLFSQKYNLVFFGPRTQPTGGNGMRSDWWMWAPHQFSSPMTHTETTLFFKSPIDTASRDPKRHIQLHASPHSRSPEPWSLTHNSPRPDTV